MQRGQTAWEGARICVWMRVITLKVAEDVVPPCYSLSWEKVRLSIEGWQRRRRCSRHTCSAGGPAAPQSLTAPAKLRLRCQAGKSFSLSQFELLRFDFMWYFFQWTF